MSLDSKNPPLPNGSTGSAFGGRLKLSTNPCRGYYLEGFDDAPNHYSERSFGVRAVVRSCGSECPGSTICSQRTSTGCGPVGRLARKQSPAPGSYSKEV